VPDPKNPARRLAEQGRSVDRPSVCPDAAVRPQRLCFASPGLELGKSGAQAESSGAQAESSGAGLRLI
jgi:hypothetical protein